MRLAMEALRRLQQIKTIFQPRVATPMTVMRPYTVTMNGVTDGGEVLQNIFSDINANLITSEAHCTDFMKYYNTLPLEKKGPFLCLLAQQYGMDKTSLLSLAQSVTLLKDQKDPSLLAAADRMRSALRPKYKALFTHIGRVNGGVKFLVDLRAEVLSLKQSNMSELNGALYQDLNSTVRELLLLWFTVGFLNLERITWNSPCDLVQKVSNYEAVHPIKTLSDIKKRVGPYRRCFIFTHNSMPREPVVVLHTALTQEISSSIQSIIRSSHFKPSQSHLGVDDNHIKSDPAEVGSSSSTATLTPTPPVTPTPPQSPNTPVSLSLSRTDYNVDGEETEDPAQIQCAVFYSITSTQKGLQGIDMGNYLIKSAVRKLQEEFPHLRQFSSLSPIPGFRDWLLGQVKHCISVRNIGEDPGVPLLLRQELSALEPYRKNSQRTPLDTFKDLVTSHEWYRNTDLEKVMAGPLLRLCALYLYVQKRRSYALNPVANFHLSNGAELWRINFLADTSQRGLAQSCGLMVNYRYFLESTASNSRNYLERHQIAVSQAVLRLLQGPLEPSAS